jgi:SAM-dependent MidA family methyltransferase
MTPLLSQLITRIQREGPLTFAAFMEAALYDPEHGYYGSGRAKIGARGDFHTAVSVGPLFGALLARQFVEMWERLERPAEWTLVEQGAFDGQLAADVLSALNRFAPECLASTILRLVEPLSSLRERQEEMLLPFESRVRWHTCVEDLPLFCGVHYSNELLDAFPVHRLRLTESGWREMRVGIHFGALEWVETPLEEPAVKEAAALLHTREMGAYAEVCTGHAPLLRAVASRLKRGWLLALDYGMSDAELALPIRREGTLSAYKQHQRREDLLSNPGEQDLTAQVNFTAVARHGLEGGWTLEGFAEQHRFFTGLASLHFEDATAPLTKEEQRLRLAFRTLTDPQLMGFQFKALCLGRQLEPSRAIGPGGVAERLTVPTYPLSGLAFARNPEVRLFGVPVGIGSGEPLRSRND